MSFVQFEHHFKVPFRHILLPREFDVCRMCRLVDASHVRGRSHIGQRLHGMEPHVDGQFAQRVQLQHLALQGVAVAKTIILQRQNLRVGDLDTLL